MKKYPAKLLLYGEHTVLVGSSSLALPLTRYAMSWVDRAGAEHQAWLREYIDYLSVECAEFLDIQRLKEYVVHHGIQADIPIGYGMGSSGALTAAIFDICGQSDLPLDTLQGQLGRMESFFHGQSSGFDPLISYIQKPILKKEGELHIVEEIPPTHRLHWYLLDSGQPRQGKTMIEQFLAKEAQQKDLIQPLIHANNEAIQAHLDGEISLGHIRAISQLQYDQLSFMIIDKLRPLWQQGLDTGSYYMKVCGAGGGGYYLVASEDDQLHISSSQLTKITV